MNTRPPLRGRRAPDLAARVDAAARSVPGVTDLFPPVGALQRAARAALGADAPFATIAVGPPLLASIDIGVDGAAPADAVAAEVAAVVRVVLAAQDPPLEARVRVRVRRISPV